MSVKSHLSIVKTLMDIRVHTEKKSYKLHSTSINSSPTLDAKIYVFDETIQMDGTCVVRLLRDDHNSR